MSVLGGWQRHGSAASFTLKKPSGNRGRVAEKKLVLAAVVSDVVAIQSEPVKRVSASMVFTLEVAELGL